MTQANARQTLSSAVIFRDGLQHDAPPKISIDLNVPLVPTSVGGIAPAFFLQKLENRTEKMMSIVALFAPIN